MSIVVPIGCGGDDDDDGGGYLASCDRACARVNDCAGTDTQTCSNDCRNTYAAVGPNVSSQYLAALDQCIQSLSCAGLLAATYLDTCDNQARASIGASATVVGFCETWVQECGGAGTAVETACIESLKVFSDAALNGASRCLENACAGRVMCVLTDLGAQ
jgi:hypothetical protein